MMNMGPPIGKPWSNEIQVGLGLRLSLRLSSYNTLFGQSTACRFSRPIVDPNTLYSHTPS